MKKTRIYTGTVSIQYRDTTTYQYTAQHYCHVSFQTTKELWYILIPNFKTKVFSIHPQPPNMPNKHIEQTWMHSQHTPNTRYYIDHSKPESGHTLSSKVQRLHCPVLPPKNQREYASLHTVPTHIQYDHTSSKTTLRSSWSLVFTLSVVQGIGRITIIYENAGIPIHASVTSKTYACFLYTINVNQCYNIQTLMQHKLVRTNTFATDSCFALPGSQSPQHIHQYATLMSPNQGETAVCGSTIFVWDDWGGDHWFPVNRAELPAPSLLNTVSV